MINWDSISSRMRYEVVREGGGVSRSQKCMNFLIYLIYLYSFSTGSVVGVFYFIICAWDLFLVGYLYISMVDTVP